MELSVVYWYFGMLELRRLEVKKQPLQLVEKKKKNHYSAILMFLRGSKRVLRDSWDDLPQFGVACMNVIPYY